MGWACSVNEEEEKRTQGFGGETRGETPLGRPSRRWEDNIKMYLQEMEYGGMEYVEVVQDRESWFAPRNAAMNFRVPLMWKISRKAANGLASQEVNKSVSMAFSITLSNRRKEAEF